MYQDRSCSQTVIFMSVGAATTECKNNENISPCPEKQKHRNKMTGRFRFTGEAVHLAPKHSYCISAPQLNVFNSESDFNAVRT